jgi:putative transposase
MTMKTRSKYGNTRVVTEDGQVFHSKKEKARYDVLKRMEENGEIWNLRRQVRYTLLPPVFETKQIRLKTRIKEKVIQLYRETTYAADFVYMKDGVEIVEGTACPDHIHICLRIAPKHGAGNVVGGLKGKSAIVLHERHPGWRRITGRDRTLWARGYYVSKRP